MKLLLDENLSYKLVPLLDKHFPLTTHVSLLKLQQASDREIWDFAKKNNFAIVTKDSDFVELSQLMGPDPRVVWLKLGNCSNDEIAETLIRNQAEILNVFSAQHGFCLEFIGR